MLSKLLLLLFLSARLMGRLQASRTGYSSLLSSQLTSDNFALHNTFD
jgi:hypothetical protein